MANAEGANFSTLSSQDQDYLTRLQHQTHTLHQRRHQSMTSGASGFQPNAWGCPQPQIVYTEDSCNQARDEKYRQAAYYDETARSFSAAAAVAAVAAAAYISSSNAVVSSGHFPDSKSIKYESVEGEKSINSLQENSGACKAGYPGSGPEACGCSVKPMNFGAPTSGPPAPEAHSNPVHFLSTLTDISCPGTVTNLSKFPPFINGTEARSYVEAYATQSQAYISPSAIAEPASSSSVTPSRKRADKPPAHVKKPLNAFMLFMKEMRAKVVAECTMKESAAINQILGRKWHALPHEEQAKFYEMARKEKEIHQRMYPGWSARDNYAYHAKRRKNRSRYRVYNNPEMLAEQSKQMKETTSPPGGSEAVTREKASLSAPVGLGGVLRGSAFYRSPFALGQFGGCGGRSGGSGAGSEQCCAAPEEAMPYFGGLEHHEQPSYREQRRHHHQQQQQQQHQSQQPFFLNISPSEPSGGVKEEEEEAGAGAGAGAGAEAEEGKNRVACAFSECVDLISTAQHFTPSASWLSTTSPNATVSHAGVNHRCQLAYDTISSASTSPWSQTHQQVEERFQRQLAHPTCGVIAPNQYSTPPYNPNGNFDYRYGDLNLAYISTPKASPVTTTLEGNGSLRSVLAYETPGSKSGLFQQEYGEQTCEEGPSTTSTYGFSSS